MPEWPSTRITLLDRIRNRQDQEAWAEFVQLYGPLIFHFARRRLPQDEDAADIMQEVLGGVLKGRYERPKGRFQKWLVTIILNKVRNFHLAKSRRHEVSETEVAGRLQEEPSREEEAEWDQERERHLFHAAAERVRGRANPVHWEVFERSALQNQTAQEVAAALHISLTNVYAIKSRIMKEIKDEVQSFGAD